MYKEFLRVLSLQPGEDLAQERTYHFLKVPDQRRGEREKMDPDASQSCTAIGQGRTDTTVTWEILIRQQEPMS